MEKVTQPPPDTHHQFIHIRSYSDIFKFPSSDSESAQQMGPGTSWMKSIRGGHPTLSQYPSPIYTYWELQWYFQIFLFRFWITSKNGLKDKLNEINQRWSPDPLLMFQHCFRYSRCYGQNQLLGPWYSEFPQKTGPRTGQIIQIYFWPN